MEIYYICNFDIDYYLENRTDFSNIVEDDEEILFLEHINTFTNRSCLFPLLTEENFDVSATSYEHALQLYKAKIKLTNIAGVNVIGYINQYNGIAQNSLVIIQLLQYLNIPYSLYNINYIFNNPVNDSDENYIIDNSCKYDINLIILEFRHIEELPTHLLRGKINIAVLATEEQVLQNEIIAAKYFHAFWLVSDYCTAKYQECVNNIPLITMPLLQQIPDIPDMYECRKIMCKKYKYCLQDKFIVMFMYNHYSGTARKNPTAVIKAFKQAFANEQNTLLIIKVNKYDQTSNILPFHDPNILIIQNTVSRQENYMLQNCCDVYISLHVAEGFGLTIAEAMMLGKPTIATNYSANLEYMHKNNSFLVDGHNNIEQAAQYLTWIKTHPNEANNIAKRGQEEILAKYSYDKMAANLLTQLNTFVN